MLIPLNFVFISIRLKNLIASFELIFPPNRLFRLKCCHYLKGLTYYWFIGCPFWLDQQQSTIIHNKFYINLVAYPVIRNPLGLIHQLNHFSYCLVLEFNEDV